MVKKVIFSLAGVVAVTAGGCSFFSSPHAQLNPPARRYSLDSVEIADPAPLVSGGRVFLEPFSPGPNVAADERADQAALSLIAGTASVLETTDAPFTVIKDGRWEDADFVIQGRLTRCEVNRPWVRWWPGKTEIHLAVRGEIRTAGGYQLIARFSHQETQSSDKEGVSAVAHAVGKKIGLFLLEESSAVAR